MLTAKDKDREMGKNKDHTTHFPGNTWFGEDKAGVVITWTPAQIQSAHGPVEDIPG